MKIASKIWEWTIVPKEKHRRERLLAFADRGKSAVIMLFVAGALVAFTSLKEMSPLPIVIFMVCLGATSLWRYQLIREIDSTKDSKPTNSLVLRCSIWMLLSGLTWSAFAISLVQIEVDWLTVLTMCLLAGVISGSNTSLYFFPVPMVLFVTMLMVPIFVIGMLLDPIMEFAAVLYWLWVVSNGLKLVKNFDAQVDANLKIINERDTVALLLGEMEGTDADWLFNLDEEGNFKNVSGRFARALSSTPDEIEGKSFVDGLLGSGSGQSTHIGEDFDAILELMKNGKSFKDQLVLVPVGVEARWLSLSAKPNLSSDLEFLGYKGVGSDVTDDRRAQDRINAVAKIDSLTGVPTRAAMFDELREALLYSTRNSVPCGLLYTDLDGFKSVNDIYGHPCGDELLKQIVTRIDDILDDDMTLCRLGGDEFAVIVPKVEFREDIEYLSQMLVEAIAEPFDLKAGNVTVGLSVGIAVGPADGNKPDTLIENADMALYAAKKSGKGCAVFFDSSMREEQNKVRLLEEELFKAIENEELCLVYQPVYNSNDFEIESFEALLRWEHPHRGLIMPEHFLTAIDERSPELRDKINEWIIHTACCEAAKWPEDKKVSINVSENYLSTDEFFRQIVKALGNSGIEGSRLMIEISASMLMNSNVNIDLIVQKLSYFGAGIIVDKFGNHDALFDHIGNRKFIALKLDRGLLSNDDVLNNNRAFINAFAALSKELDIDLVASGAETSVQVDEMKSLGCTQIQGHHLSVPLNSRDVRKLLSKSEKRANVA